MALALCGAHEHRLEHPLPGAVQVDTETGQHLGGHAVALAHQAQQDVLGADVVVAQLEGLPERKLQHLLGPGRKSGGAAQWRRAPPDRQFHRLPHYLEADVERGQRLGRHAVALPDEAQQEVLGADEVVVQQARFFLGTDEDQPRPVSEALEHRSSTIAHPRASSSPPSTRGTA